MTEKKFELVEEKSLGKMDDETRMEWDRLHAQQERLRKRMDAHDTALDEFWQRLTQKFGCPPQHDVTTRYRVGDGGEVFSEICPCPECQAKAQNMSVSEVVERMAAAAGIPPQVLAMFRKRAGIIDSTPTSSNLLN